MTSKMQFECQGDSPLSLDLLHLSIPLVHGVFPGHRYFVLVLLVGVLHAEVGVVERDIDIFVSRADVRIAFRTPDDFLVMGVSMLVMMVGSRLPAL